MVNDLIKSPAPHSLLLLFCCPALEQLLGNLKRKGVGKEAQERNCGMNLRVMWKPMHPHV